MALNISFGANIIQHDTEYMHDMRQSGDIFLLSFLKALKSTIIMRLAR